MPTASCFHSLACKILQVMPTLYSIKVALVGGKELNHKPQHGCHVVLFEGSFEGVRLQKAQSHLAEPGAALIIANLRARSNFCEQSQPTEAMQQHTLRARQFPFVFCPAVFRQTVQSASLLDQIGKFFCRIRRHGGSSTQTMNNSA